MESQIATDLRILGLNQGDHVLVTSDVRFMRLRRDSDGRIPNYAESLLDGLIECVGPSGTVIALTFTKGAVTPTQRLRAKPFQLSTPPSTGGLAQALLDRSASMRSSHPLNSITALGSRAQEFIQFHTPSTHCTRPFEDLVRGGGKLLNLGCVDIQPGFSTVHLAQLHLGLSTQTLLSGRIVSKYRDPWGKTRTFRKRDVPGCSQGFGKLYDRYRQAGILAEGTVARAPAMLIGAEAAYEIDYRTLLEDPTSVLCDDPDCLDCRVLMSYNSTDRLGFGIRTARRALRFKRPEHKSPS